MPRQARAVSESGIYHVMLRGVNRQPIFVDGEDNERFLEILRAYKQVCGYELYAYCLMGNHVHLLMKVGGEDLSKVFKRIGCSYSYWFNRKYERTGHVFQDRYRSKPVTDDGYLLAATRYIHQNPLKAGLCDELADYPYSSYRDYIGSGGSHLTDTGFVLSVMNIDELVVFHQTSVQGDPDGLELFRRLGETEAREIIEQTLGGAPATLSTLPAMARDSHIADLRLKGLSIRQISRLTGVSFAIARKR